MGGRASIDSSTFDNIAIRLFTGPAIEYNLFPYSQYTRRQLRFGYAVGPYYARYREETLFFTMSDTMAQQEASVTLDQREPWGSLQAEFEYSTFLPDALALPHPARRRRQRAAGTRPVTVDRGQHEPHSRSDFHSPPGRDATRKCCCAFAACAAATNTTCRSASPIRSDRSSTRSSIRGLDSWRRSVDGMVHGPWSIGPDQSYRWSRRDMRQRP